MTKAELIKALDGIPDDTQLYVWVQSTHDVYDIEVDVFTDGEDDTIVELVHLNVYDRREQEQEMQEFNAHLGRIE